MESLRNKKNTFFGIWQIFRAIAVITFSGSLIFINIAFAWKYESVQWQHVLALVLGCFLINGFLGHSLNDINDWLTGTDVVSKGILSGGSKVIKNGVFDIRDLNRVAHFSLTIVLSIGLYLYFLRGLLVLAALAYGIFVAWAYTCPPFRLAYKPIIGEWIVFVASGIVLSTASFFVLTGGFHIVPFFAGIVQTTLLTAWIMQHHIPDIPADLSAKPKKLTTPALFFFLWGKDMAAMPAIIYYGMAAVLSIIGFLYIHRIFVWMIIPGIVGICVSCATDTKNVKDATNKQLITTLIIIANSIAFALFI